MMLGKDGKPVIKISVDAYRKQTTNDFFRLLKLLELQTEWDMEDINAALDYIAELEKELGEQKSRKGAETA